MNTEITTSPTDALELVKAEIDMQIATAKKYPRDLVLFQDKCKAMISTSPEIAAGCNYLLTKGGKSIKGPSVRLAEIVQNNWGNLRSGAKVLDEGREFIVVQGACHDLESNVAVQVEVKRRITKADGKRYGADMIQTTTAAAISIAIRNAVFKVVPNVYTKEFAGYAEKVATGSDVTFPEMVKNWIAYFTDAGITEDRILERLNIDKKSQISKAHLSILQGIGTALNDNMTTLEVEFPTKMKEPQAANPEDGGGQPDLSDNFSLDGMRKGDDAERGA